MCLIVVAWRAHPDYPLVVAANRDEFYARPTALAGEWPDIPGDGSRVIGGRDLEAGGTWLGITGGGRFAAVTNVREPGLPPGRRTRGALTADFLLGRDSPAAYAAAIDDAAFAGYNLLLGDGRELIYRTNRHGHTEVLPPGLYGLSNHRLDTPWPKLTAARDAFAAALSALPARQPFFDLLADTTLVDDERLPQTGVPLDWERRLSAIFVQSADYGTRASTVLTMDAAGGIDLSERSFGPHGKPLGETGRRWPQPWP